MKRSLGLGLAGVCVSVLVLWTPMLVTLEAKEPTSKAQVAPAASSTTAPAKPGSEKVAYTFPDEAKIQEFTKLWQQRQASVLRMTVLQSYWNEEQAALAELNNKLTSEYKVDTSKNYFLDREHRTLVEREAPPAPQATAQPATEKVLPKGAEQRH